MSDAMLAQRLTDACLKHLVGESLPRLEKCLSLLSQEEIWLRPNPATVSVGNLVLHLCGNVRQYIISGLGGEQDVRRRQAEFDETGPLPTRELLARLRDTVARAADIVAGLTVKDLLAERVIQGLPQLGVHTLVHVVEHFSYHVGQISYFVKARKALDLEYYKGRDLNLTH